MTRHRLDLFSLLAGLVITTVAVLALTGGWVVDVGPWLWPSILIGAGLVVLLALLSAARDRDGQPPLDAATEASTDSDPDALAVADAAAREAEAADPFGDHTI